NPLVIDPFSVPKRIEESGLTPDVVSNRIGDAFHQMESNAQTQLKKDNLTLLRDEGSMPDVEIPGTKLSLKTMVEVTRAILGIHPKHVSGDIVALTNGESSTTKPKLKITVYFTQKGSRTQAGSLMINTDDVDKLAQAGAEIILEQIDPYILAVYRYDHGEGEKAVALVQRIVQDPSL